MLGCSLEETQPVSDSRSRCNAARTQAKRLPFRLEKRGRLKQVQRNSADQRDLDALQKGWVFEEQESSDLATAMHNSLVGKVPISTALRRRTRHLM
ncbi:hypothetical protein HPB52_023813 [Rhipicephalus sanguineus]|uniref:Uncharacterized protein n=1 Tax=Rhipicephalus sanguineus TaxID=34632 RepID=A0A9D4PSW4_RHISA|nr:hypothetical protein HPB52_023813 [Rhipicephalus sanguineus]